MYQPPRVSTKNIQFNESIGIREIPRKESLPESVVNETPRRSSWDPNLNSSEAFNTQLTTPTKQKHIVIGIVVGGIILIAAVIGTVVGVVLSQKTTTVADNSLAYNQACTTGSNQCISSQGLSCSNGFCSCSSPYSWNTATTSCTLLTYNQGCASSNQCYSSLGLSCTNNLCQCDGYHIWSSSNNTCITILNNTLSYGATCVNGTSQCNSSVDLTCTSTCSCLNGKIWNISSCVCSAGTFLNSSNLCQPAFSINQSCTIGSNQCDSTKNLLCNNSLCQCDYSTKYWSINYQICLPRLNYSDECNADGECKSTLICPTVPGVCNCSSYLPDYVCNCANTNYYDTTLLQCVNRASFGGSCIASANYTCLLSLYCNAGTCACPTGTSWVSANSTCVVTG